MLSLCREYFEETYAQLAASIFSEHADAFPSDTFTAAAFTWAAVTVRSRSRPPLTGDDFALVPIADLVRQALRHVYNINANDRPLVASQPAL